MDIIREENRSSLVKSNLRIADSVRRACGLAREGADDLKVARLDVFNSFTNR
jgi:hypothetical protein